jgi:transposase
VDTKATDSGGQWKVCLPDGYKTLDIHPFMLSRWRKEYREGRIVADKRKKLTSPGKEKKDLDRLRKLERENARLKQENDLLKKWQRYLAEQHQSALDSSKGSESN